MLLVVLAKTLRYALAFSTVASLGSECLRLLLPWFLTEQGLALPAVPYNSLECLGDLFVWVSSLRPIVHTSTTLVSIIVLFLPTPIKSHSPILLLGPHVHIRQNWAGLKSTRRLHKAPQSSKHKGTPSLLLIVPVFLKPCTLWRYLCSLSLLFPKPCFVMLPIQSSSVTSKRFQGAELSIDSPILE